MTDPLHIQLKLSASPERIFQALTHELPAWFAEYADVRLPDRQYDFWGRFTPELPDRAAGNHPLSDVQIGHGFTFDWHLQNQPTQVMLRLLPVSGRTVLSLRHAGFNPGHDVGTVNIEDFWFLSLENLRRHLDGKRPVRCDFSTLPAVGDVHHTVDVDAPPEVVFDALIKPEQLNRWIASQAAVEPRVGGSLDLGWGSYGAVKILELIPNEKIALSWPEDAEGPATVLTWTLEGSGGQTRLTLVHSGFAPDKPTGGIQSGWLNFASWLKSVAEYGTDWEPAVKFLSPDFLPYYPGSMGLAQASLIDIIGK